MSFTSYNAKDTTIIVDNTYITGLAEEFWTFTKREAIADDSVGALGDVVRNEKNNPIWDAELTVMATSPQANFLMELKNRKKPFAVWCINNSLDRREGGSTCMVNETTEDSLGVEAGELTFKFSVYDGDITKASAYKG